MKQYKIKKGDHYASVSIFEKLVSIGYNVKTINLKFLFRPECWWTPARNNDDFDLNKLAGIGFGLNHHKNSVRLTWVPDFDKTGIIKVFGYTYDEKQSDPKFTYLYITSVSVLQTCQAKIDLQGSHYLITVNGTTVSMDNHNSDPKLCFRLYPYFGGNNTAPQDMIVELEY